MRNGQEVVKPQYAALRVCVLISNCTQNTCVMVLHILTTNLSQVMETIQYLLPKNCERWPHTTVT